MAIQRGMAVTKVRSLEGIVADSTSEASFRTTLITIFALQFFGQSSFSSGVWDPATFAVAPCFLIVVLLFAVWIPARHLTR